jgi:Rrf2 family transcriptional regulator, nitric oxide-sensitive transcriptional repressor
MQLSLRSDYSLRVLVYLGTHPDRVVTTQEVSIAYGISKHHLVRIIQALAEHGYIQIHAGRSGGITLAREPQHIPLGNVVRDSEPNMRLVECFDRATNTCRIAPCCSLKGMLREALEAFIASLNRHTLADILGHGGQKKLATLFANFTGSNA